mgnify:CR=1 FL=1|jgi:hypothetical protein
MDIESITFDTANSKLIVTLENGAVKEYTQKDKEQYLIDHPTRGADIVAMKWNVKE